MTQTGLTGINLNYVYPGSNQNNGQITQMTDGLSGEQVVYTYDSLKRLIEAQTAPATWGQSFGYDGFGNLLTKTPTAGHSGTNMSLSVAPTTNHLTTNGFGYDANGNMTSYPVTSGTQTLSYNVENRTGAPSGMWYDLENQPLLRDGSYNLYGLNGERLETVTLGYGEYTSGQVTVPYGTVTQVTQNVYFAGRLIQSNGKTVVTDRLGSVRANESGEKFEYLPYGEQYPSESSQGREKFGTYTREASTGLDYANQRYYSSGFGVFTVPDPYQPSADPTEPVSMSKYGYSRGDPINRPDPSGLASCGSAFGGDDSDADLGCYDGPGGPGSSPYAIYRYYVACPGYGIGMSFSAGLTCAAFFPAAQSGGSNHPTPAAPPPPPQCFAQLKDRPVNDPNAARFAALHTFWWVQGDIDGTVGQFILSAGPTRGTPQYLNASAVPGNNNGSGDNSSVNLAWSSGLSSSLCIQVDSMIDAAQSFPNNKVTYDPVGAFGFGGPNSNSFSHYLQSVAGFFVIPPITAYGWYTSIQYLLRIRPCMIVAAREEEEA